MSKWVASLPARKPRQAKVKEKKVRMYVARVIANGVDYMMPVPAVSAGSAKKIFCKRVERLAVLETPAERRAVFIDTKVRRYWLGAPLADGIVCEWEGGNSWSIWNKLTNRSRR